MSSDTTYPIEDALQAQRALRNLAGLTPERFPLEAFVGMISDEIEHLRKLGHSDQAIADVIEENSPIKITGEQIAENYASPEARHSPHG